MSRYRDNLVVRLAVEGIPRAAIARALSCHVADVEKVLDRAVYANVLHEKPPTDWPSTAMRRRTVVPQIQTPSSTKLFVLQLHGFTPMEALVVAALQEHGTLHRAALLDLASPDAKPKILDVVIYRIRRRLAEHGIRITTYWGQGYGVVAEDRGRLDALVQEAAVNA